jgi:hypothetical protein
VASLKRIRKLEWLMKVMATWSSATDPGGAGNGGSDNPLGQGVRSARIRQRNTASRPRDDLSTPGLKNRSPSKWSETG